MRTFFVPVLLIVALGLLLAVPAMTQAQQLPGGYYYIQQGGVWYGPYYLTPAPSGSAPGTTVTRSYFSAPSSTGGATTTQSFFSAPAAPAPSAPSVYTPLPMGNLSDGGSPNFPQLSQ